ncbi:MAG: polyprenyl synthetase family protein [Treponema sp.]|nr:polyprenyl synthetase family protein [Treponema sp.]
MNKEFQTRLEQIEMHLKKALETDYCDEWRESSFSKLPHSITQNKTFIQKLIEPNKNLLNLGGKRWRPLFLILCYEMAKSMDKSNAARAVPEQTAYALTQLVEFVHTASLIHDDIEDNADLRRGKPAAHIQYGLDTALNSASWLYFEAPVCLNTSGLTPQQQLTFYKLYTNELRRLHLGQAMDIYWHREKEVFPTVDEYKAMVKNKTGTLSSLAAQTGLIAGGMPVEPAAEYGEIAAQIGIGFQIIDDVINLTDGNPGKKRGDDIVEGKKSLPILLHIQKKSGDKEKLCSLMTRAAKEGIDSPAVEECINLLNTTTCIQDAAKEGQRLIEQSCQKFEQSKLISELFTSMIPEKYR